MFLDKQDFCLHIEKLKLELNLNTYIETILWYLENEFEQVGDEVVHDYKYVASCLNRKIKEAIAVEANDMKLVKDFAELIGL